MVHSNNAAIVGASGKAIQLELDWPKILLESQHHTTSDRATQAKAGSFRLRRRTARVLGALLGAYP